MADGVDPIRRFASRVEYYVRSRPGYPAPLIDFLYAQSHLDSQSVVADVGSGTGILTKLFLDRGSNVIGIEPNVEMRAAGEKFLRGYSRFTSVDASAEDTGLPANSIDLIVAGQAFHWFDPVRSAAEFRRLLKRRAGIALIWNERKFTDSGFDAEFDAMIHRFTTEPRVAAIRGGSVGVEKRVLEFFGDSEFRIERFGNHQLLDWNGLLDRVYSSSYMPLPDDPSAPEMERNLRELFDTYAIDAAVRVEYETRCFYGGMGQAD